MGGVGGGGGKGGEFISEHMCVTYRLPKTLNLESSLNSLFRNSFSFKKLLVLRAPL